MDKNKNRTDLLAAGRKRLQQFRKKKDGKGNKSSAKASNSEIESDADSASADKAELVSDREGSSVNDSDSHTVELLPEEQVSVGNDQSSDHVESINVVEKPIDSDFGNSDCVGDSRHSAILDIDDSANLKSINDATEAVCIAVNVDRVDGADQGGDCLALQQMVRDKEVDLKDDAAMPGCNDTVKTTTKMSKEEPKMEELSVGVSPTIKIIDVPASSSATNEVEEVLEPEGTLVSALPSLQPFKSSTVKTDISIPDSSATDAITRSCSQSVLPDSHIIERMKEQLYLAICAKDIYRGQLDEQSKLQFDFDQKHHQLLLAVSSAANSVSDVGQRNESLCEELAKCKSDLEAAVGVKNEIETEFYAAKSELVEITMRADGLHVELQRSHDASTRQLAEIAECKTLVATLQAEIDTLNGNLTTSVEGKNKLAEEIVFLGLENEKLLTTLVECKDSLKWLQVEHANLNDSLVLTLEERRILEEAKDNFACENDKLLTELTECKALLKVLQVDNDKLNGDVALALGSHEELAVEKSHFASENEKLLLELAGYKDLLAGLQLEHDKALNELIEAKSCLEQPFEIPRDGKTKPSSAQLKDPDRSFVLIEFKGHLEEAEKLTRVLDNTIEQIYSHSMFLSTSSGKTVAPVSKLIQAFESKAHHDDDDEEVVPSTENNTHIESILLAKEQSISLRKVVTELHRDSVNAIEALKVQKNRNLADVSLEVSYEAPKEYCGSCEATSIENIVLYEFVKRQWIDIEEQKVELLTLYGTIKQHSTVLEAENIKLVSKIGVSQSRTVELERKMDEMISSSDELVFSLTNKVDALCKEVAERDLKHDEVIQSVRQLGALVGSPCPTLETVHDMVGFVALTIDAATNFIKILQENLEACKIDHKTVNSSYMDMVEKCNNLEEKNELAIGVLHHLRSKLKKLVTSSSELEEKSQIIEENENFVDPLHLYNYDSLIEQITVLLNERLQFVSENNNLISELSDKENHVVELKKRSLDSDDILHLIEDIEGTVKMEDPCFNSDKLELRLQYLMSFLFQKYKEADDHICLSRETNVSHEMELSLFQGQIESLSFLVAQHENEIIILKESLRQGREAFVALQSELQGKVNELEQSEQKVSSIREKLSIAVSKGKGLIVQRDSLKQSLAETSSELEKYVQELQLKDSILEEVEAKLKTYSEAGERVEALESELSYIRNSATALRESFILKDSMLQRIEEILEDLELPENFHSRDIIEKVDWLARSVTGNALPLSDWDQKSSVVGGSYTDDGVVATDSWKEDVNIFDNDLRKKYEELQSKFYGLAEQNDMLEQSLMERNNVVQRWEEIIDRVNMPSQFRSMESEGRIEWLVNALSEAHQHCGSLQQKVDHLETYCTALTADLDQSQMMLTELDAALRVITCEKEQLLQNLDSSTNDNDRASQMVAKLEFENDKLQNEATVLQDKLSVKVKDYELLNDKLQNEVTTLQEDLAKEVRRHGLIEGEIRRLVDLVSNVLQGSIAGDVFTSSSGTECLEQLLQKLVEQYTTLSLQKTIISVPGGEHIAEEAGAINANKRGKEDIEEKDATASREELEEALCALMCVKEERDKLIETNQSLAREVETLDLKRRELQELLSQEEQKSASVREKLNVAVRKGKSLVQHRDSLKQVIEEMNNEMESLKSKNKIHETCYLDYEQKMEDLSSNKKRVEVLELENVGLKNLLADTKSFLQEKTHTLSMVVDSLNGFDVSFNNVSDPVEKLNIIVKSWQNLHVAMVSSENNFNKAKRSAELLLAELNEVQERNDLLQEELAQVQSELPELSRERDFAEASKHEAISQLQKLSSSHYDERNNQLVELMAIKSCLTELTESFYSVKDLFGNVLSKEVEYLYNLETSLESSLEPSSAHEDGLSLGDLHSIFPTNSENREKFFLPNSLLESKMQECIDDDRLAEVCGLLGSRLQVFLKEVGVMKEELYKHTSAFDERAKHLSKVAGIVCREVISQKQSLGSMAENSIRVENIEKERNEESVAMHKSISLLFEACSSSVLEIENWKSQFTGSSLAAEDIQKFNSSIDFLSSEQCRTLADRLLFSVKDFIRFQTEIVEGGQKDMKATITNLQKELQEKDIQKERICVEFVNQIREAESAARSHLQVSNLAKSQLDDVKGRLGVIEDERNMLKQRIKELEDGEFTLKELDERARSLNSVLVAKEQEIEALMQALDEEETQMEDLTNKIWELEQVVQKKNSELENIQASRSKVTKKLSITVGKFDELHLLSASLLSEVEKLQSQVRERDEEISFLRQEVTRSTNDALLASQMSNKRKSNELHDIVTWLSSIDSGVLGDVEGIDDLGRDQASDYKELLQKQIGALLSQLEDVRAVVQSKDMLLQVEKTKVEELMHRGESLENTLREKDSQLSRISERNLGWMEGSTSEIVEAEPVMNTWSMTGTSIAPQVRTLRKSNNDQVAIAIDTNTGMADKLEDDDDDKAHGFKSLTTSRIVPRFSRPVTDMIDGLWVSCDRTLMRQPALRLGVIIYWAVIHALLATFVV